MVCRADQLICFLETSVSDNSVDIPFLPPIHTLVLVCQAFFLFTFSVSKKSLNLIRQGRVVRVDRRFAGDGNASSVVLVPCARHYLHRRGSSVNLRCMKSLPHPMLSSCRTPPRYCVMGYSGQKAAYNVFVDTTNSTVTLRWFLHVWQTQPAASKCRVRKIIPFSVCDTCETHRWVCTTLSIQGQPYHTQRRS